MPKRIIALSGPVSSGKSALSDLLAKRYGYRQFRTREVLHELSAAANRQDLQKAGEDLDKSTNGEWVKDALSRTSATYSDDEVVIIDSVRIKNQISALRRGY